MNEATPDGVGIFTPLRDEHGAIRDFRYLYVNPVIAKALGRTAEDVKGRTLQELVPGLELSVLEGASDDTRALAEEIRVLALSMVRQRGARK